MKYRILPTQVLAAYREKGIRPAFNTFLCRIDNQVQACALSVFFLPKDELLALSGNGAAMLVIETMERLGYCPEYRYGFQAGYDGHLKSNEFASSVARAIYDDGYWDGTQARRLVLENYAV